MHPPDRALHIALLLSFSAYYSTVASLLGLAVRQTADNPISYHDFPEMTEPSEMSAPSSTTHSTSSPHFSLSARLSFAARNSLDRLANPLRLKLAKHSTHHLERTTWLSAIPTTRRSQDDFICASMGFTPEYLKDLRSTAHRATFIYIIDEILLKDSSHGLSTAVKNLACFILASSTENSVLTAHSAFLANRFGAHDRQLSACMDISLLQEMQKAYEGHCPPSVVESASESSSFASSEEDEIRPAPPPARRRRRGDRFRFPEFSDGSSRVIDRCDAEVADYGDCLQDEGQACKNEYMMDVVDDVNTGDVRKKRLRRGFDDRKEGLSEFQRRRMRCYTHMDELDEEKEHEEHDMDLSDSESDSSEQSVGDYDLVDNIEVPEVNGLNAMRPDQEGFENRDLNKDMDKFSKYEDFEIAEDGSKEGEEELDMSLFSLKEVTFLLLSHEVAQGSRRNSRVCSKYAEAKPDALVSSELAKLIHSTFEKEAIMEMVSVIAAFNMLQRWTVCYPYKPGTLEAPVRRFVQTPIAHDLCVDAVGQRSSSRYSIMLRVQTGRALRLPRHAVVAPVEAM